MRRRPLLVIAGWLGAAALALVVGLAATNLISRQLTSSDSDPISQAEAEQRLAAPAALPPSATASSPDPSAASRSPTRSGTSTPSGPAASTSPSGSGAQVRRTFSTAGGTVITRCVGPLVEIASMSPAQGYAVHEQERGLDDSAEGEFRSTSDNHVRVEVDVRCVAGTPRLEIDRD